ncbi:MAG TPA: hypothetical protein DCM26_03495 [Desulfotomaculum sp.]|jgi:hypothetical protein|nr:hypothetical protein [Desulfotomaculum sp.]
MIMTGKTHSFMTPFIMGIWLSFGGQVIYILSHFSPVRWLGNAIQGVLTVDRALFCKICQKRAVTKLLISRGINNT